MLVSARTPAKPSERVVSSLVRRSLSRLSSPESSYLKLVSICWSFSSRLVINFAIISFNFESFPDSSCGVAPFASEATPFLTRDMMRSPLTKGPLVLR